MVLGIPNNILNILLGMDQHKNRFQKISTGDCMQRAKVNY